MQRIGCGPPRCGLRFQHVALLTLLSTPMNPPPAFGLYRCRDRARVKPRLVQMRFRDLDISQGQETIRGGTF
jgi:hypothetical protein